MHRRLINSDITHVSADALIYSTNVRLALTGGVGAALVRRFGIGVQIQLQDTSLGTGRQMAEVGEIICGSIEGSPWSMVFHTIATDELYHTDAEVVRRVLSGCLARCAEFPEIRSIVCSPLGAGYGDLELPLFLQIATDVCVEFERSTIQSFAVVVYATNEYTSLCSAGDKIGSWQRSA